MTDNNISINVNNDQDKQLFINKINDFFGTIDKQDLQNYILFIQKGFFVALSLIYTIFAIVIVRQVSLMSKNVQDKFNYVLILFSYIHLVLSVLLIIFTLLLL